MSSFDADEAAWRRLMDFDTPLSDAELCELIGHDTADTFDPRFKRCTRCDSDIDTQAGGAGRSESNECPQCGSDLERVECPTCGGMRVEHATGWACGECDEDGEVLVCVVCRRAAKQVESK